MAAPLIAGRDDLADLGVEGGEGAQAAHDRAVRIPEPCEYGDETSPPGPRVGIGERLGEIRNPSGLGEVVAHRLEQGALGPELVIDGGTGHIRPFGHRVHGEPAVARRLGQQRPRRVEDLSTAFEDLGLAFTELVGAGAHLIG